MTRHAIPSLPHIISKVSTWAVPATRPMEPSLRTKSCQKPSSLSAQAAGSGSPPRPRSSFFALFLEAFSDPRVYRYPAHLCSEVLFLQRQKDVFKSSYRGRGMGPPPGIHFCMCCYHNQQNQKTETKKNGAKLFYCGNSIFFAFSQRAPDCSIVVTVFNKTCDFFGLCFFVLLIVEAAHAKADP